MRIIPTPTTMATTITNAIVAGITTAMIGTIDARELHERFPRGGAIPVWKVGNGVDLCGLV
jgi:hypothetical protein